jgi:hypothetical protein
MQVVRCPTILTLLLTFVLFVLCVCVLLQACLKCLAVCVSLQHLPGLAAAAASAGKAVSSLLRKVPDAAHPLAQDCFKLLGGKCCLQVALWGLPAWLLVHLSDGLVVCLCL